MSLLVPYIRNALILKSFPQVQTKTLQTKNIRVIESVSSHLKPGG